MTVESVNPGVPPPPPAPLVSVIVNCYNGGRYLREALDSVRAQTFTDWELVFWDNQSTDGSAEIFRSIGDPRFRYLRAPEHTTLGAARNLAVAEARGQWLAFLDCDDHWDAEKLELQMRAAKEDAEVGLVYGPVAFKLEQPSKASIELRSVLERVQARPHPPRAIYHELLQGNWIIFSSAVMRASLFGAVGGIIESLRQNEDYDLLLKISRLCKAVCIDKPCAVYRLHASNNSLSQQETGYLENRLIYEGLPQEEKLVEARRMNASRHAVFLLRQGRIGPAMRTLLREGSVAWTVRRMLTRARG